MTNLHDSSITCVAFEGEGTVFASGGTDGVVKIVSCFIGEIDSVKSFSGPFADVRTAGEVLL
jgi:WD40 repeat protein